MINKVSKRINELIQSQQQTPTSKNKVYERNLNSTPQNSKKSDRINISGDNDFINQDIIELKKKTFAQLLDGEDPLNRTRSIYSDQKLFKEMGTLIEHYKSEIINMLQPLIYEVERKLITRIVRLEEMMMELSQENECLKSNVFQKQFTLAPVISLQKQNCEDQIKTTIRNLVIKAETIQSTLETNSRSIFMRLENLQLKSQVNSNLGIMNKNRNDDKCICQGFLEKILATETSLTQEIKFIKHQIQKLKDKD